MSIPTSLLALERHEIGLVLEGLAAGRFQEAGLLGPTSKARLLFKGSENVSEVPFSVDTDAVIKKFAPDVVVTTRSIPESLEGQFGLAANRANIPVVLMEDYWGCCQLYKARPDVVVTP